MSDKKYTISHYILDRLKELGCDDIFGVPGDFVLGFFHAFEDHDINCICTCNELNASYAADGYARIKGIGAVTTTYVVGELSGINGIAGAYAEKVPVVKITGWPATKFYDTSTMLHHTLGDYYTPLRMYKHITVAHTLLSDVKTAPKEIDRVLAECYFHKRPAYIALPSDVALEECKKPESKLVIPKRKSSEPDALEEALKEAKEMLDSSKKPIIIVDGDVQRFEKDKLALEFIEKTGIPFASMLLGKSVIEEHHSQFIGLYGGDRSREYVKRRVEDADCIVVLGYMPTDFNTGGFSSKLDPKKTICIGVDRIRIKYHEYHQVNFDEFLKGLSNDVTKKDAAMLDFHPAKEGCPHRATENYEPKKGEKLTVSRFFSRVSHFLNENSIMIVETGLSLFAGAEVLQPKGSRFMSQAFFGSIGYTVGATLGVSAAAKNKRVCTFVGDGSFQVTCQDVSTMIRNKLNPIIFLINNDGYLIERVIIDGPFNDIQPWHYSKLPELFGGGLGIKVHTEDELENALETACKHEDELVFIEVVLDKWDSPEAMTKAGKNMAKNNNLLH